MCEEGDIAALIALAIAPDRIAFTHLVYEGGNEVTIYRSYQALLVEFFRFRWEGNDTDETLTFLTSLLQLQHLQPLRNNTAPYEVAGRAVEIFRASLEKGTTGAGA
jgi:hypothetical protein